MMVQRSQNFEKLISEVRPEIEAQKKKFPSATDIQLSLVEICDLIVENNTRLLSLEHSVLEIDEMILYKDEKINHI